MAVINRIADARKQVDQEQAEWQAIERHYGFYNLLKHRVSRDTGVQKKSGQRLTGRAVVN